MFFSITVGAKVEGRFGDFLPLSAAQLTSGAKIRRIQAVLKGVVVKSLPAKKWQVFWNSVGGTSDHREHTLQYMSRRDKTTSSKTLEPLDRKDIYLGDQDDLRKYTTTKNAQKLQVIMTPQFK